MFKLKPGKIRTLSNDDFNDLDRWFGVPHRKDRSTWPNYHAQAERKEIVAIAAELDGQAVGFCALRLVSSYGPFRDAGMPEIIDLLVAPPFRRRGVGHGLVEHLEDVARSKSHKTIGLAVGLYAGYGAAQRLYARLGYVPDGRGITHRGQPVDPCSNYPVDDDLLLWLTKPL